MIWTLRLVVEYAEQTNDCEVARKCIVSSGKYAEIETTKSRTYAGSM
jgi:hypothetical protein